MIIYSSRLFKLTQDLSSSLISHSSAQKPSMAPYGLRTRFELLSLNHKTMPHLGPFPKPKIDLPVPTLLPPPFCVLFQAHPRLKFALKVSNFYFFSKQLHISSGTQMLILCTEECLPQQQVHSRNIHPASLMGKNTQGAKMNQGWSWSLGHSL